MKYLLLFLLILSTNVYAQKKCISRVKYIRTYDGDTFFVDIKNAPKIFGKNIGVRIRGINAPEIRGNTDKKAAIKARDFVHYEILTSKKLKICNCSRGKYFRIICDVRTSKYKDLGKEMIKRKLAEVYK